MTRDDEENKPDTRLFPNEDRLFPSEDKLFLEKKLK